LSPSTCSDLGGRPKRHPQGEAYSPLLVLPGQTDTQAGGRHPFPLYPLRPQLPSIIQRPDLGHLSLYHQRIMTLPPHLRTLPTLASLRLQSLPCPTLRSAAIHLCPRQSWHLVFQGDLSCHLFSSKMERGLLIGKRRTGVGGSPVPSNTLCRLVSLFGK
jgi:hypothetical protein